MGILVRVSAKSCRLRFHGCDPAYIAAVCHGRCCESSAFPAGTLIAIAPGAEEAAIRARGGTVVAGLLQPRADKKCPFKAPTGLCSLHGTPAKPFGCIASPFMLNPNGTLIVRNRYKLFVCYNVGPRLPAYVAFRGSLDLLFGPAEAARLCAHLAAGGGDCHAELTTASYRTLTLEEQVRRLAVRQRDAAAGGGPAPRRLPVVAAPPAGEGGA